MKSSTNVKHTLTHTNWQMYTHTELLYSLFPLTQLQPTTHRNANSTGVNDERQQWGQRERKEMK